MRRRERWGAGKKFRCVFECECELYVHRGREWDRVRLKTIEWVASEKKMNIKIIMYSNVCTFMLYLHQQQQHVSHSYARKKHQVFVCRLWVCSMLTVCTLRNTVHTNFYYYRQNTRSVWVSVCPIAFDGVVHQYWLLLLLLPPPPLRTLLWCCCCCLNHPNKHFYRFYCT